MLKLRSDLISDDWIIICAAEFGAWHSNDLKSHFIRLAMHVTTDVVSQPK